VLFNESRRRIFAALREPGRVHVDMGGNLLHVELELLHLVVEGVDFAALCQALPVPGAGLPVCPHEAGEQAGEQVGAAGVHQGRGDGDGSSDEDHHGYHDDRNHAA